MAKGNISSLTEKQLEQILAKKKEYVVKSDKQANRSLGLNPTTDNVAEVLATLIKDLKAQGILK